MVSFWRDLSPWLQLAAFLQWPHRVEREKSKLSGDFFNKDTNSSDKDLILRNH